MAVKLNRIDSDFYTFFLWNEEEQRSHEFQVEPYSQSDAAFLTPYMWSVYDDRNRYVASYMTLADIRTSF